MISKRYNEQMGNYLEKLAKASKPQTNADRIRAMTDDELANMWVSYVDCGECPAHRECNMLPQDCLRLALEWLKKEVDG